MPRKKTKPRKPKTAMPPKKASQPMLFDEAQSGQKKVLHVGCGQATKQMMHPIFHSDDWQEVRLDIAETVNPDIVADMRDMPQVESDSMDALFSSHNLEHVYAYEVPNVLAEFFRILKPGGFAMVTLPDIQAVAFAIAQGKLEEPLYHSPSGPIAPLDILYGHGGSLQKGHHYMAHKTGFSAQTLGRKVLDAGFHNVKIAREKGAYNLWVQAFKPGGLLKDSKHQANVEGNYPYAVINLPRPGEKADDLDAEPRLWNKA